MRKIALVILSAVLVISTVTVIGRVHDSRAADRAYEAAQELASPPVPEPTPEPTPEAVSQPPGEPAVSAPVENEPAQESPEEGVRFLTGLNLAALRQVNDRVLGWIYIPDSPVDYPLLEVRSNNEYLRRAWDGTPNNAGCIFLECRNRTDFGDFNTLIYGHFMRNGTMFGSLHSYWEQEYRDSHPYIYIVTGEAVRRYEVFSAYEADVVSDTYRLFFEDDARKQSVLDHCRNRSVIESRVVPTVQDRILTLSTCTGTGTYDTRWVVQAVLSGEFRRE